MLLTLLAGYYACVIALYAAMVGANARFYRRKAAGSGAPLTVIKPMRGAEEDLERKLRSLLDSDPEGRVQVLFAVESREDPAYPVASRLARERPDRDVAVLVTGPSG
ncbi:MAG: hypothetical protein HY554_16410, partial [Elusimicrobia bacterium]|nr:hypothetical protein [Elusimicrobiota bacterium]